jgi:hypothetical protein
MRYRPRDLGTCLGALALAAGLASAQPANDNCENATVLPTAGGTYVVDFAGAVIDTSGPLPSCMPDRRTVWYSYTAPGTGSIDFTMCDSGTIVGVSLWSHCEVEVACSSHTNSCPGDGSGGIFDFEMTEGETVLIGVSEYILYTGPAIFNVVPHFAPPPANDTCAGAIALGNGSHEITTEGATGNQPFECQGAFPTSGDVWYRYTATCSGFATANFDVGTLKGVCIEARSSCNGTVLDCGSPLTGTQSVTFPVVSGNQYLIRLSGFVGGMPSRGTGTLTLSCNPPAVNDTCETAQPVTLGETYYDTRYAQTDWSAPECVGIDEGDVFFSYTPTQDTFVYATTGYGFPTSGENGSLSIYTSCDPNSMIECDDMDSNVMPDIEFLAEAGQTYILRAASTRGFRGGGMLFLREVAMPIPEDECAGARPITLGETTFDTTRFTAGIYTSDDLLYCFGTVPSESLFNGDIWFTFVAPEAGTLSISTTSQNYVAEIYDTCGGSPLGCTELFSILSDGRDSRSTCFEVYEGQEMVIRVGQDFFPGGGVSGIILAYLDTTPFTIPSGAQEEAEPCAGIDFNGGCAFDPDNNPTEEMTTCTPMTGTFWNDWETGLTDVDVYAIELEGGTTYTFRGQAESRTMFFVGNSETCYHGFEEAAIAHTDGVCKTNFEVLFTPEYTATYYVYAIMENGEIQCGDRNRYWTEIKLAAGGCPGDCVSDFDDSGFVDTDDFDAFVRAFEAGTLDADVDATGFVDTDDFDFFVRAFEAGC